jgi:nucleoside phosphorylase
MEGYAVLRACALADVPAVEVRALANAVAEPDRRRWRFADARVVLAEALARLVAEVGGA